jgi:hypothetical protein
MPGQRDEVRASLVFHHGALPQRSSSAYSKIVAVTTQINEMISMTV